MKVKELLRKYNMRSNATVRICDGKNHIAIRLENDEIKHLKPESLMMLTVYGFSITDNVMDIFVSS